MCYINLCEYSIELRNLLSGGSHISLSFDRLRIACFGFEQMEDAAGSS